MSWRRVGSDVDGLAAPVMLLFGEEHPEDQRVEAESKMRLVSAPVDWSSAASGLLRVSPASSVQLLLRFTKREGEGL